MLTVKLGLGSTCGITTRKRYPTQYHSTSQLMHFYYRYLCNYVYAHFSGALLAFDSLFL